VLKSDLTIRHGSYTLYRNHQKIILGYFKDGKKDSVWTTYNEKGEVISKGRYINDKKEGRWVEFDIDTKFIENGSYKNGRREGKWVIYVDIGDIKKKLLRLSEGYYKKGLKDGRWVFYARDGKAPRGVGNYVDDELNGKWIFYRIKDKTAEISATGEFYENERNGKWNFYAESKLVQTYNFDSDKLTIIDSLLTVKYQKVIGGTYDKLIFVDSEASFVGGFWNFFMFFNANFNYPRDAFFYDSEGATVISFIVDSEGKFSDLKIVKGTNEAINKEIVRVFNLTKDYWIPATIGI